MRVARTAVLLGLAAGCGEPTRPPQPALIALPAPVVTFDAIGAKDTVTAIVRDASGQPLPNAAVTWTATANVSVTPLAGATEPNTVVLEARAIGTSELTLKAGSIERTLPVEVRQIAASIASSTTSLTGTVGETLPEEIRIVVRDRLGVPAANVRVTFAANGGAVAPAITATGADGVARGRWTLGTQSGTQIVTATADAQTVVFRATVQPGPAVGIRRAAGSARVDGWAGAPLEVTPSVRATDAYGNPVGGIAVSFSASAGALQVTEQQTDAGGVASVGRWTLGTSPGTMVLTATAPSISATETFTVDAVAGEPMGTIELLDGADQLGTEGRPLPEMLAVRIVDTLGNAQPDRDVILEVVDGGGTVSAARMVTGADGVARVEWTLGSTAMYNSLRIRLGDGPATNNGVVVNATGCTGGTRPYVINVCFVTPMSVGQRAAFLQAADRWSSAISADIADVELDFDSDFCDIPRIDGRIDDVVIFATVEAIDGPSGVLGSAGPCLIRNEGNLPLAGRMRFDLADMEMLESAGHLRDVIVHEMGHVIGIGTIWSLSGHLQQVGTVGGPTLDTHFDGPNAILGFDQIGGTAYTAGAKVPVANVGRSGSINSHWRESELRNELMTPTLNSGTNPLTALSILSLKDLGYEVNPGVADAFIDAPVYADPRVRRPITLENDVDADRLYSVDRAGRVRRVR